MGAELRQEIAQSTVELPRTRSFPEQSGCFQRLAQAPQSKPDQPLIIHMCSCSDAFWSKTIAGTYKLAGSNHGKPIYKRSGPRNILFIYYWDNRDGAHYSGWWFGSSVGGCNVCAFNPDCQKDNPLVPATFGWKVPADGPVDEGFRIIIGGQSCLPTSIQAVTPDVTMITTSNQKFGTVGPAHAADLAEEGKQESTASPENNETVQEMQKSAAVVGERPEWSVKGVFRNIETHLITSYKFTYITHVFSIFSLLNIDKNHIIFEQVFVICECLKVFHFLEDDDFWVLVYV